MDAGLPTVPKGTPPTDLAAKLEKLAAHSTGKQSR